MSQKIVQNNGSLDTQTFWERQLQIYEDTFKFRNRELQGMSLSNY